MRTVHVPTPSGHIATLHISHPADYIQNFHINGWWYERDELALMASLFPEGGLFLDVGANVGNHSVYLGLERSARCVCVEPNPAILPTLRANLQANINDGGVIEAGLGKGHSIGHGLRTVHEGNQGGTWIEGVGTVEVISGDSLNLRPDLIKIDTEGMELDVLAGLERTISESRPVLFVEVMNDHGREFGRWAEAHGYKLAALQRRYAANGNYLLTPA